MDQKTELAGLPFWPRPALERLSASWITTAEQVVAIAATDGGIAALAQQTGLDQREVTALVDRTRSSLSPAERERLSKPADTRSFGRGALDPDARGKR
jgi:hypothetical protein